MILFHLFKDSVAIKLFLNQIGECAVKEKRPHFITETYDAKQVTRNDILQLLELLTIEQGISSYILIYGYYYTPIKWLPVSTGF